MCDRTAFQQTNGDVLYWCPVCGAGVRQSVLDPISGKMIGVCVRCIKLRERWLSTKSVRNTVSRDIRGVWK